MTLKDKLVTFFAGSRLPRDFVVDHLSGYLEDWLLSDQGEEYLKSLGYQRKKLEQGHRSEGGKA